MKQIRFWVEVIADYHPVPGKDWRAYALDEITAINQELQADHLENQPQMGLIDKAVITVEDIG